MWVKQCHKPSPSHHHVYRWYAYHSQSWVVYLWHCFTHITWKYLRTDYRDMKQMDAFDAELLTIKHGIIQ